MTEEKFNLIISELNNYFKILDEQYDKDKTIICPSHIQSNHKAYLTFVNDLRKRYLNKPPIELVSYGLLRFKGVVKEK